MQKVERLYETFQPAHYQLELDLTAAATRVFSGTVTITGTATQSGSLKLHAKGLDVTRVRAGAASAQTSAAADDALVVSSPAITAGQEVTVTLEFTGTMTDAMHGLYPCYYEHDGTKKELWVTQLESHHARELFPCVDEPEAKATFDLALQTPTGVTVLSNMPPLSSQVADGTVTTAFATTPRMSTYLLAFVVGELHRKTGMTKSGVEVNVWATPAQPAGQLDFPLDVAIRSIEFFDEYFDVPYPLPKADHVALPDFSSGAMENWGLITYREVALLADESTAQSSREMIATVITHETSHQWFGNLVTMKWWDDLWLNESFATVMEHIAVDALFPDWHTWNNFASMETLSALRRDQIAGVQPVKLPVNHPDEISTLFDPSIVYAKGARLLRMLRAYVGEEAFRTGLTSYFKKHAYQNTTGADLWAALSTASGKDVGGFMEAWLTQSGLPLVSVMTTEGGYELSQQRFVVGEPADERTWPIPLSASNAAFPVLLSEPMATVDSDHQAPLLNVGNTAHFVSRYDAPAWQLVLERLTSLATVDRLALLHESSLLTRSGHFETASLLPLLEQYQAETKEPVWSIIAMVIGDLKRFVEGDDTAEAALKSRVTRWCRQLYERLGNEPVTGEPEQDTKLRATVLGLLAYADNQPAINYALTTFDAIDDLMQLPGETRPIILGIAAKHGTTAQFDRLLEAHRTTSNAELREDLTSGLCSTIDETQIGQLLGRLTDPDVVRAQDLTRWFIGLLRNRYSREATWKWMTTNWQWIEDTFGGDKSYDDYVRYSASIISGQSWLERYRDFFTPLMVQPSLKRAIEIGLTEITARTEWLERDGDAVRAALVQETS